jgi:hypothetical protein
MKTTSLQKAAVLLTLVSLLGASCAKSQPGAPTAERKELATAASGCGQPTFKIDPKSQNPPWVPPGDINGGAASASLQDAAVFAWQEFIALNWPAVPQNGQLNTRDQPDPNAIFGDPKYSGAQAAGPLVWHTFRHKSEIFPGTLASPNSPHGYVNDPTKYYGYDDPPQYIYTPSATASPWVIPPSGQIPPFASASNSTPWINLDEQSEIGLDAMFAGNAPTSPFPGQQILFLAKANRAEYTYVAQNNWWGNTPGPPTTATSNYIAGYASNPSAYTDPQPGSSTYVSFLSNTIEVKSAWRQLTTDEMNSGRFYTTTVRYYNAPINGTNPGQVGYVDAVWGLVALHIIQKTPSAPYFIYATFSQADNLLDAKGNKVEDVNGTLLENSGADPLEPNVVSQNATSANPATPQSVQHLTPATSNLTPAQVGKRVFFTNSPTTPPFPPPPPTTQGMVALNRREHNIPQCVIDVNTAAHAAIAAYGQEHNVANPVWQYYKLVSVQYQPYDKPAGTTYAGTPGGPDPATYYQANEVVESDYNLQVFSGRFQDPLSGSNSMVNVIKLITDFTDTGTPFKNVFYNTTAPNSGKAANMGGCMGCHGNAQNGGADFSFILDEGPVGSPDVANGPYPAMPPPVTPSAATKSTNRLAAPPGVDRFQKLFLRRK